MVAAIRKNELRTSESRGRACLPVAAMRKMDLRMTKSVLCACRPERRDFATSICDSRLSCKLAGAIELGCRLSSGAIGAGIAMPPGQDGHRHISSSTYE